MFFRSTNTIQKLLLAGFKLQFGVNADFSMRSCKPMSKNSSIEGKYKREQQKYGTKQKAFNSED